MIAYSHLKRCRECKIHKEFISKNTYFSIGTLNGFVHSPYNLPIAQDLINFADNFESYITLIIEDLNQDNN